MRRFLPYMFAFLVACRPTPASVSTTYVELSADPDKYIDKPVRLILRIDSYDPATRTATRTLPGGTAPIYRLIVAGGGSVEPGNYEVLGVVVECRENQPTGLPERNRTLCLRECRLTRLAD